MGFINFFTKGALSEQRLYQQACINFVFNQVVKCPIALMMVSLLSRAETSSLFQIPTPRDYKVSIKFLRNILFYLYKCYIKRMLIARQAPKSIIKIRPKSLPWWGYWGNTWQIRYIHSTKFSYIICPNLVKYTRPITIFFKARRYRLSSCGLFQYLDPNFE